MSAHILVADDQSISRTIIDAHSGRPWPQLTATGGDVSIHFPADDRKSA